ncbi:MAG: hypothetical protein NVSMB1_04720 [Polyangiales bacterium]
MPLQSAKPAAHALITHEDAEHDDDACATGAQAFPHAPQLLGSLAGTVHFVPQQVSNSAQATPPPQVLVQTPPEHDSVGPH